MTDTHNLGELRELLDKYRELITDVAEHSNNARYQAQNHPTQFTRSNINGYFGELEKKVADLLQTKVERAEEIGFVRGYTTAVKAASPHITAELAESLRFHHPIFGGHPHKLSKEEQVYFKKVADELGLTISQKEEGQG